MVKKLIVLIGCCLLLSLHVTAQTTQKIDVDVSNIPLKTIFTNIERDYGYTFMYSNKDVDDDVKVSIKLQAQSIDNVLKAIFQEKNILFEVKGNQILLKKGAAPASTAPRNIKGLVLDDQGEPAIGTSVTVKGTSIGTTVGFDGKFELQVPANATLEIVSLGFATQELKVNNRTDFSINLAPDAQLLDQVVVVGYGTVARRSVTGAVDQIQSKVIEERPVANLAQALQGTSPSLVIQQKSFNPNDDGLNINIRGISTMNNNDPLIVIDGLIVDISSMNALNPADIDNISILKDAGSAAIYGSRSSNGVILITTKKGRKNEKTTVKLDLMTGFQVPHMLYTPVRGFENAILYNQALVNGGNAPFYTPEQIRDIQAHPDSEWFINSILKTALQQTYNMSISGGSQNTTYMVSGGLYDQRSNFVGDNFGVRRYNFRSNLATEIGRLKITSIMAYSRFNKRDHTASNGNIIADATRVPTYYYNQLKTGDQYLVNSVLSEFNPLGLLEAGGLTQNENDNFIGSIDAEYKIMEGLSFKAIFGGDLRSNHRLIMRKKVPFYRAENLETPSSYGNPKLETEDYNERVQLLNAQALLNYNRTFGSDHTVTGLLGASSESYKRQENELKKRYTDPDLGIPTSETIIDPESYNTPQRTSERGLNSVFGRVGYAYKEKYYGEVSLRYDGTSKFNSKNRWGLFPSFSGGWRLSEELFLENYKQQVGDIKFRGSYGILGNQNVDDYQYQTTYGVDNNKYGFNNIAVSGANFTFGNPDLRWETSATLNLGIDLNFFQRALNVSADFFNKITSDILITPEVPSLYGGAVSKYNAGKMRNQGWEITVQYRFKTSGFNHSIGANLGDSWNKVLSFDGHEQINGADQMSMIIREGLPYNSYFGYKTNGYYQNMYEVENSATMTSAVVVPGDVRYVDRNDDGVIDGNDRYVLGNAFPRLTFGLTYDVTFAGFDLSMLVQGVGKRQMFLRGELIEPFHSSYYYVMFDHQLDYWKPTNPTARWPRLAAPGSASNVNNYQKSSDIYVLNAAYVRLKNIQLGYTIPKNLSDKLGTQRIRAYVNAQNLFTLSKTSFVDPESTEFRSNMSNDGANSGRNYPSLIYYGFGLDIQF